jgi:hypothetical protein
LAKGKKISSNGIGKQDKKTPKRKPSSDEEAFLRSAETALVNHLKQLGTLSVRSTKKEKDPLSRLLRQYVQKWRDVEK